jgi:hypothetical protein
MVKQAPVGIRWNPEERAALEAVAASQDRSLSAMVRKIVVDWLRLTGWLEVKK